MSQKIHGDLEVTGAITGAIPPISVPNNWQKLALTGLVGGEICHVNGEGGRIEQYVEGNIADDASWAVLRNTIYLSIYSSYIANSTEFNGWVMPLHNAVMTYGWIKDDSWFSLHTTGFTTCFGGTTPAVRQLNGSILIAGAMSFRPEKTGPASYTANGVIIPSYPDRAVLEMSI